MLFTGVRLGVDDIQRADTGVDIRKQVLLFKADSEIECAEAVGDQVMMEDHKHHFAEIDFYTSVF